MSCFKCNRREAIKTGANLAAGVALSGGLAGALAGCGGTSQPTNGVTNGGVPIPNDPSNLYTFDYATFTNLGSVGGSMIATVEATSGAKTVSIARTALNSATTVSVICTHQGCQINAYDAGADTYTCPCHGSVFSGAGTVLNGPATLALPDYSSSIVGQSIQVTIA